MEKVFSFMFERNNWLIIALVAMIISCSEDKSVSNDSANEPEIISIDSNNMVSTVKDTESDNALLEFSNIDGKNIILSSGDTLKTSLHQLKFIGSVENENKNYFILKGVDCSECDAPISIYFHSPSNGDLMVFEGQDAYTYPGNIVDYMSDSLLYHSSAYFGQVTNRDKGIIWFIEYLNDELKWDSATYIARIRKGKIVDTLLKNQLYLSETKSLAEKDLCFSIKEIDTQSQP